MDLYFWWKNTANYLLAYASFVVISFKYYYTYILCRIYTIVIGAILEHNIRLLSCSLLAHLWRVHQQDEREVKKSAQRWATRLCEKKKKSSSFPSNVAWIIFFCEDNTLHCVLWILLYGFCSGLQHAGSYRPLIYTVNS